MVLALSVPLIIYTIFDTNKLNLATQEKFGTANSSHPLHLCAKVSFKKESALWAIVVFKSLVKVSQSLSSNGIEPFGSQKYLR